MGLFSFIGDLIGGNSQKNAISQAIAAQSQGLQQASTIGQNQFVESQQNYSPYSTLR